jgi:hypothetical protein
LALARRVEKNPDRRVAFTAGVALGAAALLAGASQGCGPKPPEAAWEVVQSDLPGALPSVWGTAADDIYVVGGIPPSEPLVLHFDGAAWTRLQTGATSALWWSYGFAGGPVYMVGYDGLVLRYDPATGEFTEELTPGTQTLFGVWGPAEDDLWAVGGLVSAPAGQQAVWHRDATGWTAVTLPPAGDTDAYFKVWGSATDDVWIVGRDGLTAHWDGVAWSVSPSGAEVLFTVHTDGARVVAVGDYASALIAEWNGAAWDVTRPSMGQQLNGVWLSATRDYAVGNFGEVYSRPGGAGATAESWAHDGVPLTDEDLHAVWVDPTGDAWACGGNLLAFDSGVVLHYGLPSAGSGVVNGL